MDQPLADGAQCAVMALRPACSDTTAVPIDRRPHAPGLALLRHVPDRLHIRMLDVIPSDGENSRQRPSSMENRWTSRASAIPQAIVMLF